MAKGKDGKRKGKDGKKERKGRQKGHLLRSLGQEGGEKRGGELFLAKGKDGEGKDGEGKDWQK